MSVRHSCVETDWCEGRAAASDSLRNRRGRPKRADVTMSGESTEGSRTHPDTQLLRSGPRKSEGTDGDRGPFREEGEHLESELHGNLEKNGFQR